MHKVLVLGAGLVSRPVIQYFLENDGFELTVGTLMVDDARAVIGDHPTARAIELSVTDSPAVAKLVSAADLVVSLVPFHLHAEVARIAVAQRVHLVTTSYASSKMRELDSSARDAGVLLLNECGLDPGIDHMSAMRLIDAIHSAGGKIVAFESCCGGLPSLEAANNPWRYKFSWSPRGVLIAGTHTARYLVDGEIREIPGPELFTRACDYEVDGLGQFEMYPNRDSIPYREIYGLKDLQQMLRGTIRYPGWSRAMKTLGDLGWFDTEPHTWQTETTNADLTAGGLPAGDGALRQRVAEQFGLALDDDILDRLAWAGLFADDRLASTESAPIDELARIFADKMSYQPGERDMVVMQHSFGVVTQDGRNETHRSQLIAYGDPEGFSATSRTVSWPAAIAARLILEGRVGLRGVQIPNQSEIYEPVLTALEPLGLRFREWVVSDDETA